MRHETFSMHDTARLTGATPRQVDHFVTSGLVVPAAPAPRRGVTRMFSLEGLVVTAVARELIACGVTGRWLHFALDRGLRRHWAALCDPRQRREREVLVLWSLAGEPTPNDDMVTWLPSLTSIERVQAYLAQGNTIHAVINVKNIIETIERATGLMLNAEARRA